MKNTGINKYIKSYIDYHKLPITDYKKTIKFIECKKVIGIKKDKRIMIKRYIFANKGRSYIQKATVRKSQDLILSFLK